MERLEKRELGNRGKKTRKEEERGRGGVDDRQGREEKRRGGEE